MPNRGGFRNPRGYSQPPMGASRSAPEKWKLEPGRHRSPAEGVCIVELASILAGEEFSDRPGCVCEVLAAFLRNWNDRTGYADRQRVLPYAERLIRTGGDPAATRRRRGICLAWAGARLDRGRLGRALSRLGLRLRIAWRLGPRPALRFNQGAGEYAAQLCFSEAGADAAFALLDRLLDAGESTTAAWPKELDRPVIDHNGGGEIPLRVALTIRAIEASRASRSPAAREGDCASGAASDSARAGTRAAGSG